MQNDLFFILYHGVWNNLRSRMIFVDDELESLSDIFGALDEVSNSSSATGRSMFYGANILLGYTSLNELLFWVSPSSATSRRRGHVVSNLPMLTKEAEGQKDSRRCWKHQNKRALWPCFLPAAGVSTGREAVARLQSESGAPYKERMTILRRWSPLLPKDRRLWSEDEKSLGSTRLLREGGYIRKRTEKSQDTEIDVKERKFYFYSSFHYNKMQRIKGQPALNFLSLFLCH